MLGTTESGDTMVSETNADTLGGSGLNGSVAEMVLATVRTNGSESFYAEDQCSCTFDGQSGTVTLLAQGRTSANGNTWGTFMVISGGTGGGGLSTLAGFGTFSSFGEPAGTLRLVEHLRIT